MLQKEKQTTLVKRLKEVIKEENILQGEAERYCYSCDTGIVEGRYLPDVVVFPTCKEDVVNIVKIAYEKNIPIISRGAGSNHNGGCVPVNGGIVLHFSKMDKILKIDKTNLNCIVQPGVIVGDLQAEVEKEGIYYPPDPSNLMVSTIGGSIALNSSGPRTFKYGATKDYVLNLEVITGNGEIINTGFNTAKSSTGYNLTQLFVGSEGTLGIVTQATLKLIAKPEAKGILLMYFDTIEDAVKTVEDIILAKISPAAVDLIDIFTLQTIEKFYPSGLKTDKQAALLIEIDGFANTLTMQKEKIIDICKGNNVSFIQNPQTEEEIKRVWIARRSAFAACTKLGANVITEDIVVPRTSLSSLVRGIQELCEKYNIKACIMGHIGDGNIHPNFILDLRNKEEAIKFKLLKDELFELAINLGGTLSGEHGIGMTKSVYMNKVFSSQALNYMKQIKSVFDPKNIFNPGKVL